ncbi:MAG: RluA family pseudouridine synthase, partial [Verrucomicrobiales bacterium]
ARPIRIPEKYDGDLLLDFLTRKFRHLTRDFWQEEIEGKRICNADGEPVKADQIVRVGERYFRISPKESEPLVNPDVRLLFEDEAIVVIEKPAPLPVHPCGRFNRNTVQFFLEKVYAPQKPHIAHRLDADTTGLMVVARTKHFASRLQPQFACGQVNKTYLARVHGRPLEDRFVCDLALSDGLSANGKREAASDGLVARTEFTVLKRYEDGTALLEVRPITGRTNQIRIHLWELGFPICGDPRYLPGRRLGNVQSKTISDTPLCLHSKSIEFFHPLSRERMKFEKSDVAWA